MEKREIASSSFGLVVSAGSGLVIAALQGEAATPHHHLLLYSGLVAIAVGAAGLLCLFRMKPKAAAATGDTYNNSGTNYGHMGCT